MKTFSQFISESGGSPHQLYKPKPQPEPSAPPAGWKEKYLDSLKKKSPKLAEDAGTGNYHRGSDALQIRFQAWPPGLGIRKTYERERMRRKHNVPSPQQINKERKLAYMLQKDLPPPEYKSSAT